MRRLLLALAALGALALAAGVAVAATPGTVQPAATPAPSGPPPLPAQSRPPRRGPSHRARSWPSRPRPRAWCSRSRPTPSTVGQALSVAGHLTGIKKKLGRCGAPVHLLWRGPGARGYSTAFVGHTTPAGAFRFTVPASLAQAQVNGTWQAHSGHLNSRPVHQGVLARLAFASPVTYAVAGIRRPSRGRSRPPCPASSWPFSATPDRAGAPWPPRRSDRARSTRSRPRSTSRGLRATAPSCSPALATCARAQPRRRSGSRRPPASTRSATW